MTKKVKGYTAEFREEAIKLALDTSSICRAAKDLGIPVSTLHNWVNPSKGSQVLSTNGTANGKPIINLEQVLEKNRQLQKRIARLEQEKSILKKAATYFAKELG